MLYRGIFNLQDTVCMQNSIVETDDMRRNRFVDWWLFKQQRICQTNPSVSRVLITIGGGEKKKKKLENGQAFFVFFPLSFFIFGIIILRPVASQTDFIRKKWIIFHTVVFFFAIYHHRDGVKWTPHCLHSELYSHPRRCSTRWRFNDL